MYTSCLVSSFLGSVIKLSAICRSTVLLKTKIFLEYYLYQALYPKMHLPVKYYLVLFFITIISTIHNLQYTFSENIAEYMSS